MLAIETFNSIGHKESDEIDMDKIPEFAKAYISKIH